MQLRYRVHAVNRTQVPQEVEIDGARERVVRDVLEVELESDQPAMHGSQTLRFRGPEAAEAIDIFKRDEFVVLSYTKEPAPAAAPAAEPAATETDTPADHSA